DVYGALARLFASSGRYGEALAAAEHAAELACTAGDQRLRVEAEWTRARVLLSRLGREEEGLRLLDEVIPLAEGVGDLPTLAHALLDRAYGQMYRGTFAPAVLSIDRACTVAERLGDPALFARAL